MSIHTIRMPDIGEGIAEVEIVEWRVEVGDSVGEDQTLCDVMTDKAAVEVPSPVTGRVVELGGEVGQVMAVGSVLIRIDDGSEAAEKASAQASPPQTAAVPPPSAPVGAPPLSPDVSISPPPAATKPPTPGRMPPPPPPAAAPTSSASPVTAPRALAAPAVRERARALGIDLSRLKGSGSDGRIVHADLDAARSTGARASATAAAPTDGTREVKLIGLRRAIAQKMLLSKRSIPHFTYVEEVDVTEMVALREALNRQYAVQRGELSPLALAIRAIVRAVADFPQVNARFDDEAGVLTLYDAVHLGVATQTDGGLMVPVLRQAQSLNLWDCSLAIAELAAKARAGKATRDELSGSTLTVTSLGKLGGIVSTPVINHPEVAIVGINRIVARPMVRDGTVQVRQMMNLSSSFDHRVVDGAVAAAYIQRVRQLLEAPATLFID
ncbi:MAG: 2-oxo acid dehydrogenase subunit [Proteobacteria bacterium]|jgi:2-oxoisovalerate dehydrogenase E2 component (dihydrolipoyl transacylase)|nr:2-oxo acid dehydrogenase subunit [Pseudomonadota bacterium]